MTIVLIVLLVLLIGGFAWPREGPYYYRYGPSGLLGLLLLVLVILLILGVIPHGL